ncbi:13155_t:CDS:2, partial [Gigaspora margarita]
TSYSTTVSNFAKVKSNFTTVKTNFLRVEWNNTKANKADLKECELKIGLSLEVEEYISRL